LCDQAIVSVKARAEELGASVTLVGQSLGGYIAREVARDLPSYVDQAITKRVQSLVGQNIRQK
jgi:alpha-beta hydrolase superfamily lysophospholipase